MNFTHRNGWRRFILNAAAKWSLVFLVGISLLAAAAPWVTHSSYEEQNISEKLESPSTRHWMGTDTLGRDVYSRVLYGARMSLSVGVFTALFSLFLGTATGALAGYRGGWTDAFISRVVELFYSFPSILMALLLTVALGRGIMGILLAIGLTSWVSQARLVRGLVLQAKHLPYVDAAQAIGVPSWRILTHHILKNISGPILISLTYQIPSNIMAESFLSFIGLGIQPPFSSWGTLANEGFRAMRSFPHLTIFPGLVLFFTLVAFNYLGDGLRDAFDPQSRTGDSSG